MNSYFDKIYCFCKPSNYNNWNIYKNIYLFYNIDVKLIPAEDIESRVVNNVFNSLNSRNLLDEYVDLKFIADSLSHTTFINHAINNNYNKILILKENIIPSKDYKESLSDLKIEEKWDFLILKNNNNIVGYGITSIFYNDLLKLIKQFKLNFDEIIDNFINNFKVFNIDSNLFFNFNKSYLNDKFISLNSLLFNKNISFVLYPFHKINFLKKENIAASIYIQHDFFEWKFDFQNFVNSLYDILFTDKKIFIIGNSFCLKINEILSVFKNSNFFVIKENIENIKDINEYKFYPDIIDKDENFIENYFNFYYDYIDAISYKMQNIKFIEIDKFEMETLL